MVLKLFSIPEVVEVEEHDYFIINNDNKDVRMVSFQHVRDNISTNTGTVVSVNGQQGTIILDADDIDDAATSHKFATAAQLTLVGTAVQPSDLNTVATSGAYSDLSGTPTLATVATSGVYGDLTGTPTLATVATSGSYNDLSNKPTIPSVPVQSVNGQTGTVSLNADNILDDSTAHKFVTAAQKTLINDALQPGDAVTSVNSKNGASVTLNPDDLDDASSDHKFVSLSQRQAIGTAVKVQGAAVPSASTDAGTSREIRVDATHLYFYTGSAWVRVAWETF